MIIRKCSNGSAIDFAAEELRKYLRMMMPEGGNVEICRDPVSHDGFRIGLMQDFGLYDGDIEDSRYDEILYAHCSAHGGVIAGNNPRAVLLAVYEYLRRCGCRWLYPGVDGEFIPVKDVEAVSFRIKPSCRHRGFANTTAASQEQILSAIDFLPKIGMNTFMVEFRLPTFYIRNYYSHKRNTQNRPPEYLPDTVILQWKRAAEAEAAKRGLLFHDVGHGFCIDAFGIDSGISWNEADESVVPEENRQYLAEIRGKRGLFHSVPVNTNFCMSNPTARRMVAEYITDYAKNHTNVDFLHVWLADGCNNHCECEQCRKKSPSDWYMALMNDIDDCLRAAALDTKIVFLAYVDTSWAPSEIRIKNEERFVFMLAPYTRKYYNTIPPDGIRAVNPPYKRNNITLARTLEEYLAYYLDWKKDFSGPAFAFEYHFCWSEYYDVSTLRYSRLIHDEIVLYKNMGIDGVVEDGDLRAYLPNGLQMYTLGRTLFDTSLSAEEIAEDYLSHVYGKDWKLFEEYFRELGECIDWKYLVGLNSADPRVSPYYNPAVAAKMEELPPVLEKGRRLVQEHFNSEFRVQTVSIRLLQYHIELCEHLAEVLKPKARGDDA